MFKDNPNFIKLDEEIYVWENFLSPEEHQRFFDLALSISEEEWLGHVNPNKFWSGKCSLNKKEIYEIANRINKLLEPEYVIPPSAVLSRTPIGQGMYVHKDRGEEGYTEVFNDFDLSSYTALIRASVLASGLIFELPILIYFLTKVGLVTPELMRKYRKISLVLVMFLSAVITPPDVASQIIVAIPVLILYELSIFISKRVIKNMAKKKKN